MWRKTPASQAPAPPVTGPQAAGLTDYLKEAFLFRWNLLLFLGGATAASLMPAASVFLPLVMAGEMTFLAGLISIPRFRAAIDAKVHAAGTPRADASPVQPPVAVGAM